MNLPLTLLAHVVRDRRVADFVLPRVDLTRAARSRLDRQGLELFAALAPIVRAHPEDRVALRRLAPLRWQPAADMALALPTWWLEAAEPVPDLLARFNAGRSDGWTLPIARAATSHRAAADQLRAA